MTRRYYDPSAGQFITRDPMGYAGGINLYAYCKNNPVNGIDPQSLDFYIKAILGITSFAYFLALLEELRLVLLSVLPAITCVGGGLGGELGKGVNKGIIATGGGEE